MGNDFVASSIIRCSLEYAFRREEPFRTGSNVSAVWGLALLSVHAVTRVKFVQKAEATGVSMRR